MGKAIILQNVDFSNSGLGRVTLSGLIPITGLSIVSPSSIVGESYQLGISYVPLNTTQRNVLWSIESGSQYANIDSSSGFLSINQIANGNDIVVKATSASNPAVYNTKTINVTYAGEVFTELSWIRTTPGCYVDTGIIPFAGMKIHCTVNKGAVQGIGVFAGVLDANNRQYVLAFGRQLLSLYAPGTSGSSSPWSSGFDLTTLFEIEAGDTTVRSKLVSSDTWTNWSGSHSIPENLGFNIYLFANNLAGSPSFADITAETAIRYLKIYDSNDTLVADFRAVLYNNTPYFRDFVSGNMKPILGNGTITYEEYNA